MTLRYTESRDPMVRIQAILRERKAQGMSCDELAKRCCTTTATMRKWLKFCPDLKWYSLMDICLGLNIELYDIFEGTPWKKIFIKEKL